MGSKNGVEMGRVFFGASGLPNRCACVMFSRAFRLLGVCDFADIEDLDNDSEINEGMGFGGGGMNSQSI